MPELVAMPQITALYAGLLGLMAVVLSILVGRYRAPTADRRVSIGDGGRPEVLVAMRRHANFVEFVQPSPLILQPGDVRFRRQVRPTRQRAARQAHGQRQEAAELDDRVQLVPVGVVGWRETAAALWRYCHEPRI